MSRWLKWHGWFVWTSHSLPWRRSCTYEFVCWRKIIFLLLMSNVIFHRSRKTYCMDAQWFVIHFLCSPPLARALPRPHRGNCTARHMFYLELSCGEDQQKLWQPETKKWYPWPNNILHKWHCALYQFQCSIYGQTRTQNAQHKNRKIIRWERSHQVPHDRNENVYPQLSLGRSVLSNSHVEIYARFTVAR